jgi:signal transduction histidine kinase
MLQSGVVGIEVISEPKLVEKKFIELVASARSDIILAFPTRGAFLREEKIGIIQALESAAFTRGIPVRVISPVDERIREIVERWSCARGGPESRDIEFREVESSRANTKVTIAIADERRSLALELKDDSSMEFHNAIGAAIYSTSRPTVLSYISFVERLWQESEDRRMLFKLLEREKRSRLEAQMLQDIISHDIRNYNQVISLGAELLLESLKGDDSTRPVVEAMLDAVDGSTTLLDRTRKLGLALSEQNPTLFSLNLVGAIEAALALIRKAHPDKLIWDQWMESKPESVAVLADELLAEVFVNTFSNSAKYTSGRNVNLKFSILPPTEEDRGKYVKLAVTDESRGIPDSEKQKAFSRFLKNAKGTGLGMSIMHALIVERYSGKIFVKDRVSGEYQKGTLIEIWLPVPRKPSIGAPQG